MKFIDEVTIQVTAGKGGDGCCSFRREKFIPFGGPDGGDGGDGGDIYLRANSQLNTLIDLNYRKEYKAAKGKPGSGNLRSGKSGEDLIIDVPVGTIVWENDTSEMIGDLIAQDQILLVAKGGQGGLGNHNFKSSVNRAPRKIIKGSLGQERNLRLELRLLADVGLLGFPNVGKSTLISKISAARPKIADYPFTTLYPHLGVVKCGSSSFTIADIPGILEGAPTGVGLGVRFLKHLSRNKLLLHMVDLTACFSEDDIHDNVHDSDDLVVERLFSQIKVIEQELKNYNNVALITIERWIVINKIDPIPMERLSNIIKKFANYNTNDSNIVDIIEKLKTTRIYWISAISGQGIKQLCADIIIYLMKN